MNLETKVKDCLKFLVVPKRNFTAYDVTRVVRRQYGQRIKHASGVREIVHTLFESGDLIFANYDRELDYSLGVSPAPWRYFPDFVAPSTAPATAQDTRPFCCARPMHKKGFGLYQVQRYRCLVCKDQQNEFSNTVFHNRKHRPSKILDALWCIKSGKLPAYTANAVGVHPRTVLTWRRVTKETWPVTSRVIQSLDQRFDSLAIDKLAVNLGVIK